MHSDAIRPDRSSYRAEESKTATQPLDADKVFPEQKIVHGSLCALRGDQADLNAILTLRQSPDSLYIF